VPNAYAEEQRRRLALEIEDGSDASMDRIIKSVIGGVLPDKGTRKYSPGLAQVGLYNGIKDPWAQSQATDNFLHRMARTPIGRMPIDVIIHQISAFGRKAYDRTAQGHRVRLKDREAKPSPSDRTAIAEIETVLGDGGTRYPRKQDGQIGVWSGDQREEADPFVVFLQKIMRDSLATDWAAFRMEPGRNPKQRPVAFFKALDSRRVRMTEQKHDEPVRDAWGNQADYGYTPQLRQDVRVDFVELDRDQKIRYEYTASEIGAWVRNPQTCEESLGYGWPELASLVEVVAGYLVAVSHNVQHFTHNKMPPGIVTVAGQYDEEQVFDFLQNLVAPGTDGAQAYKLPFLFGKEGMTVDYKPFRNAEREDMLWKNWIVFLINVAFSMFHIAAEEGNFQAFLTVGGQQTGTGGDARVSNMRWTGLRTNAQKLENLLNRNIVSHFHADSTGSGPFEFECANIIPRDEDRERQADLDDLNAGLATVNDILARRDLPELRDPKDMDLWDRVQRRVKMRKPQMYWRYRQHYRALCEEVYETMGGKWCLWPNAPANSTLNYMYSQEHQDDVAPQQDPGEQWQQSQAGGPPPEFMQNVDAQSYKAEMEKQQATPGGPDAGDQEPGAPSGGRPGGRPEPMQRSLTSGYRVFEVALPGDPG